MKIEDKIVKMLCKCKYEKAKNLLLWNNDKIDRKEFFEKFKKAGCCEYYPDVKLLVDTGFCYDTQLKKDFELYEAIHNKDKEENIERLINAGANFERDWKSYGLPYKKTNIECVKRDTYYKDTLLFFMKKGCYDFDGDYEYNEESYHDINRVLLYSYINAKIDLHRRKNCAYESRYYNRYTEVVRIPCAPDPNYKKPTMSDYAKDYTQEEIKDFARAARYGIVKKLKDAVKNDADNDETLRQIAEMKEQIDRDEAKYLAIIQEKEMTEKRQKEEVAANREKTEKLISELEESIEQGI